MATKKYVSLNKLATFLENLNDRFAILGHTHKISDISDYVVDNELSSASNNPVANSVIDAEFDAIATSMNALDAAIDTKADREHNHNDLYYTEAEVDEAIANAIAEITAIPDSEITKLFSS